MKPGPALPVAGEAPSQHLTPHKVLSEARQTQRLNRPAVSEQRCLHAAGGGGAEGNWLLQERMK